ncbi:MULTISPECIES: metal-dependent transcriptional regulator [Galbibacter]|uniref:Transcriptional regulator MntR n=1 Tax=Galbibacter pacificus TaxID=2996052 RepID=A0ABT6FSB7_9FLAO|nr:metal-dependent transcriptional regulator [Galbibacter pacificus]MDG3582725.1 metal-dependent transcriptional regulator [Galbibacter pacificus]MDG3586156.1 metal-dependent transcriptional regulator [Galbibacter pacificus]
MTLSEEDYIKAIYHLSKDDQKGVSTNAIAMQMDTKASSVTDMIKKLAEKDVVHYKKYQGARLTDKGKTYAAKIIRKHRLWEFFLVEKLNFSWDEVHDIAEELEHIKSEKLVEKLDAFLDYPRIDPHGDPIPDKDGNITKVEKVLLSSAKKGDKGIVVGVKDSSSDFLRYLDKLNIALGEKIIILNKEPFDNSVLIQLNHKEINISSMTANNIFLKIS